MNPYSIILYMLLLRQLATTTYCISWSPTHRPIPILELAVKLMTLFGSIAVWSVAMSPTCYIWTSQWLVKDVFVAGLFVEIIEIQPGSHKSVFIMQGKAYNKEVGGGEQRLFSRGPQTFRGPHEALTLLSFWVASSHCFFIFCFLLHCLHSMSERLGRIISNAFTVLVNADKFLHALVNMSNECC